MLRTHQPTTLRGEIPGLWRAVSREPLRLRPSRGNASPSRIILPRLGTGVRALIVGMVATCSGMLAEALPPLPSLSSSGVGPEGLAIDWQDPSRSWTLQTSFDLESWAHVDPSLYEDLGPTGFRALVAPDADNRFLRLRKLGLPRFYVVGDSVSTREEWPASLEALTGWHTFSQAIGGSTSRPMPHRTRGVELQYPNEGSDTIVAGPVTVRWTRHIADKTQDLDWKNSWAIFAKAVSEPTSIEVYEDGKLIGFAERELKRCSTDHINSPNTVFCEDHGLEAGDRVTFISLDPEFPDDLSVQDSRTEWEFSSVTLPSAIIERRVYHAAHVTSDSFEIKERQSDDLPLDLGSDALADVFVETGWKFDWNYTGGDWGLTWKARTKFDDWIWLLEVSANDISYLPAETVTIPNTEKLLAQLTEIDERFLIVCPPSGSYSDRGPGSFNWINYYETYMPYIRTHFPDRHIDTMALMDQHRTTEELAFLDDPDVPQLFWIRGSPGNSLSWEVFPDEPPDPTLKQSWVGPGYTPLQFRKSFTDRIHLNPTANELLAGVIAARVEDLGW